MSENSVTFPERVKKTKMVAGKATCW
jgi:hypothetical protein